MFLIIFSLFRLYCLIYYLTFASVYIKIPIRFFPPYSRYHFNQYISKTKSAEHFKPLCLPLADYSFPTASAVMCIIGYCCLYITSRNYTSDLQSHYRKLYYTNIKNSIAGQNKFCPATVPRLHFVIILCTSNSLHMCS